MAGQWPVWPREQCRVLQLLRHYYQPLPDQVGLASEPHVLLSFLWHALCWEFMQGMMGRDSFHFLLLGHLFVEPTESQVTQQGNRRTDMWVRKCHPAAPAVSGVRISWSFALNWWQMCRLWISNEHLHKKPHLFKLEQTTSALGPFCEKSSCFPQTGHIRGKESKDIKMLL